MDHPAGWLYWVHAGGADVREQGDDAT